MRSNTFRLDRLISKYTGIKRSDVRLLLAQQRIQVDGCVASSINQPITRFSKIVCDGQVLQNEQQVYLVLNKPKEVVSATVDSCHKTVIDILDFPGKYDLHIAGRLDFNSTGILLLSNDGLWTKRLFLPENKIKKRYRVQVEKPISEEYIHAFQKGMYFHHEGITTRPAELRIIDDFHAEISLVEGRYHQIKRMFGYFQNKVIDLHRFAVGNFVLDDDLLIGEARQLTTKEAMNIR